VDHFAAGARVALSMLFLVAAAEKLRATINGVARWHPVFDSFPHLRSTAALWFLSASMADCVACLLLLVRPGVGGIFVGMLVVFYTLVGRTAGKGGEQCRCFIWTTLNTTGAWALVARNGLILGFAALVSISKPSSMALGWTLLSLVVLTSVPVAERAIGTRGSTDPRETT
jgi:hypothetical protein